MRAGGEAWWGCSRRRLTTLSVDGGWGSWAWRERWRWWDGMMAVAVARVSPVEAYRPRVVLDAT